MQEDVGREMPDDSQRAGGRQPTRDVLRKALEKAPPVEDLTRYVKQLLSEDPRSRPPAE